MKTKHQKSDEDYIPKVFDDPKLQKSYEEMRKAAKKEGLTGKFTFA